MTWTLWFLVSFIGLVLFGLGCIFAPATLQRRGHDRLLHDTHAHAVLAVFFTVVALAVAVDTLYVHVQFNRYSRAQLDCAERNLRHDAVIATQRAHVDQIAAQYDIAMQEYIVASGIKETVRADDPAFVHVQSELGRLTAARLDMLRTYAANPAPKC